MIVQLPVAFHPRTLRPDRRATVDPLGRFQRRMHARELRWIQDFGDMQEHVRSRFDQKRKVAVNRTLRGAPGE